MDKSNLLTIAQRTGYSVSTVSRVLLGKGEQYRISKKAIDIITEEAEKCNYTPDLIAKSLRTKRTHTIGLTIPGIDNPFFALLSSILIREFRSSGYNVLLADIMESEEAETEAIKSFLSRRVDGIIAIPVSSSPAFLEKTSKATPIILIDRYYEKTELPYVCTDNYTGGSIAARHLIDKGYKDILAIQGVLTSMPSKDRIRGFTDAIREYSAGDVKYRVSGDAFSTANGYEQTCQAIRSGRIPDAIFALSTTIMLGAISAIREHKLRIPDDIAIISYDNNSFLDYLDPSITRIEQPVEQVVIKATKMLIDMIDNPERHDHEKTQITIRPSIIERHSC